MKKYINTTLFLAGACSLGPSYAEPVPAGPGPIYIFSGSDGERKKEVYAGGEITTTGREIAVHVVNSDLESTDTLEIGMTVTGDSTGLDATGFRLERGSTYSGQKTIVDIKSYDGTSSHTASGVQLLNNSEASLGDGSSIYISRSTGVEGALSYGLHLSESKITVGNNSNITAIANGISPHSFGGFFEKESNAEFGDNIEVISTAQSGKAKGLAVIDNSSLDIGHGAKIITDSQRGDWLAACKWVMSGFPTTHQLLRLGIIYILNLLRKIIQMKWIMPCGGSMEASL